MIGTRRYDQTSLSKNTIFKLYNHDKSESACHNAVPDESLHIRQEKKLGK